MHPFQLLALIPLALATPLTIRQSCPAPTYFQINGLQQFTPDPVRNPDGHSAVFFGFVDSTTGATANCQRDGPASGIGDLDNFYPCDNPNVSFLYGGTGGGVFDVREIFDCNGVQKVAVANGTSPAVQCIPSQPPQPLGYGTLCQFPVAQTQLLVTAIENN